MGGVTVARWVSFFVLAAIVAVVGYVFFQVMAYFLLPMFLAVILVVMFRPLHRWFIVKCKGRGRLAAALTTLATMVIVLGPLLLIIALAAAEGVSLVRQFDRDLVQQKLNNARRELRLDMPQRERFDRLAEQAATLADSSRSVEDRIATNARIEQTLRDMAEDLSLEIPPDDQTTHPAESRWSVDASPNFISVWRWHRTVTKSLQAAQGASDARPLDGPARENPSQEVPSQNPSAQDALARNGLAQDAAAQTQPPRGEPVRPEPAQLDPPPAARQEPPVELTEAVGEFQASLVRLQETISGGKLMHWIKRYANPSPEELESFRVRAAEYLGSLALTTPQLLAGGLAHLVVGLGVLVISFYYFLADGPGMVSTLMRLSPLDNRYEMQMLEEFEKISRAVVMATLLSAVTQGLLAGIAYYLVGMQAVFLLTLLTMMFAMVPFVGAAAVWIPSSLWLVFYSGRLEAGIVLALYGGLIVSMADNVIKPLVLHGQSNMHPLLALLSVLGGVQALGPIGILVGPMIVALLQALLNILNMELSNMELSNPELSAMTTRGDKPAKKPARKQAT
jgi:predicted PurR-regulated permease PerM